MQVGKHCSWGAADPPQMQRCHGELSHAGSVSQAVLHQERANSTCTASTHLFLTPIMHIAAPPACTQSGQDKQTAHAKTGANICLYFFRGAAERKHIH